MKIFTYYSLFSVYQILTNLHISLSSQVLLHEQIPKIKLQDLIEVLNNSENEPLFLIDHLKDMGGKLGILEISNLGSNYSNALKTLHEDAPKCIDNGENRLPRHINLPDGSYRKTYATTSKTYLDCVDMDTLSHTFDVIDSAIMKVLTKFNEHYFDEPLLRCSTLGYLVGANETAIDDALEKEHIHVYTKRENKGNRNSHHKTDQDLVPFHVDNGLFLIITPFPGHGMNVKLSNGMTVSTSNVPLDSALVLIGRGLTDWLLTEAMSKKRHFFPVPHSVPTLSESNFETRTIYARMKVPPPSATSAMSGCLDFTDTKMTFQEFFMDNSHSGSLDRKSQKLRGREINTTG